MERNLSKFNLIEKPIVNQDYTIIGGHQRIRILKKQKAKTVDCWVPDRLLNQQEVDELCISLNLHHGEWDYDILANDWQIDDLMSYGFTEEQLLGESDTGENSEVSEDSAGANDVGKDEDAITKLGDLYVLGNHRLTCGDSTDSSVVSRLLDGEKPILMVTDPPYGVDYNPNWRGEAGKGQKAAGKVQNDDKIDWSKAWGLFPGSVAYVWSSDKFAFESVKNLIDTDYKIIGQIIWAKQHFALSRGDYHSQHEPCWYAVRKGKDHNWQGSRKESTVWEIGNLNCFGKSQEEDERTCHSTQKPIECMARPIRNNTAEGESVYDPFLGSGTTLIAAEKLGRRCFGIEISPAYCDVIVKRYVNFMIDKNEIPEIYRNGELVDFEIFTKGKTSEG